MQMMNWVWGGTMFWEHVFWLIQICLFLRPPRTFEVIAPSGGVIDGELCAQNNYLLLIAAANHDVLRCRDSGLSVKEDCLVSEGAGN